MTEVPYKDLTPAQRKERIWDTAEKAGFHAGWAACHLAGVIYAGDPGSRPSAEAAYELYKAAEEARDRALRGDGDDDDCEGEPEI